MLSHKEKIGSLDREIYFIQSIIEQGDSNEDKIIGWELIDYYPGVMAKKIETNGTTVVVQDRVTFIQNVDWVIRFREDLNVRMRLVWDTKVYEILNISEVSGGNNLYSDSSRRRFSKVTSQLLDNIYFT